MESDILFKPRWNTLYKQEKMVIITMAVYG